MPKRKIRIGDGAHAFRVCRIANVEQHAVAGAGTTGVSDLRIDGDVVALLRTLVGEERIRRGTSTARPSGLRDTTGNGGPAPSTASTASACGATTRHGGRGLIRRVGGVACRIAGRARQVR